VGPLSSSGYHSHSVGEEAMPQAHERERMQRSTSFVSFKVKTWTNACCTIY